MKSFYAFFFEEKKPDIVDITDDGVVLGSIDELRENFVSFLSQTGEAYIDKWNVVHEVTAEDRPVAYYFEVIDDCWEDVVGETGAFLDDTYNKDMPTNIRKGFEEIYLHGLKNILEA